MSYSIYKLIHFTGIFTLVTILAGTCVHALRGSERGKSPFTGSLRVAFFFAALLVLVGGFGMLASLGVMHGALPRWVFAKLAIWVGLTAAIFVPYLSGRAARAVLVALPVVAVIAGAIALYKPF